jgi:hypothetical protein
MWTDKGFLSRNRKTLRTGPLTTQDNRQTNSLSGRPISDSFCQEGESRYHYKIIKTITKVTKLGLKPGYISFPIKALLHGINIKFFTNCQTVTTLFQIFAIKALLNILHFQYFNNFLIKTKIFQNKNRKNSNSFTNKTNSSNRNQKITGKKSNASYPHSFSTSKFTASLLLCNKILTFFFSFVLSRNFFINRSSRHIESAQWQSPAQPVAHQQKLVKRIAHASPNIYLLFPTHQHIIKAKINDRNKFIIISANKNKFILSLNFVFQISNCLSSTYFAATSLSKSSRHDNDHLDCTKYILVTDLNTAAVFSLFGKGPAEPFTIFITKPMLGIQNFLWTITGAPAVTSPSERSLAGAVYSPCSYNRHRHIISNNSPQPFLRPYSDIILNRHIFINKAFVTNKPISSQHSINSTRSLLANFSGGKTKKGIG